MKRFLRLTFLLALGVIANSVALVAQCVQGTSYGSGTANTSCVTAQTTGSNCHFINEYCTWTGLTIGNTYDVGTGVSGITTGTTTTTAGAHILTLFDGAGVVLGFTVNATNNIITHSFTATTTTVRCQINTYTGGTCGTSGSYCNYYGLKCTSCPQPTAGTNQPSTATILQGTTNNQVLRVDLPRCDAGNTLTDMSFDISSCTNLTDITNAKVYYTTTTTFATTTQFGTTVASPTATFTVTGSQTLGTANYLWLVFDISGTAVAGDIVDAGVTNVTIDGGSVTPTPANPTGTRTIVSCSDVLTNQPSTATVYAGTSTNQVLRVDIAQCTAGNPLTSATFDISSCTNVADISNAKVYYTTTTTFATTTQFGSTVTSPGATFTVTGSQTLATSNYLWLVFDVPVSATAGDILDAAVTGLIINALPVTPVPANPAGTRTIVQQGGCNLVATSFGSATAPTNPCTVLSITTCAYFGEYSTISSMVPGNTYQFVASFTASAGPYSLNLYTSNTAGAMPVAFAVSATSPVTLNYTVPMGGATTMYLEDFQVGCTTASVCNTFTIQCTSCPLISSTQPSTAVALQGSTNNQVYRVDAPQCTAGSALTSASFDVTSCTNSADDVASAKLYYTTTTTFATTTPFGSAVPTPSGTITFTGSQTLGTTNYLWLVFDVSGSATAGDILDAACTGVTIAGSPIVPNPTNPTGTRTIVAPPANNDCAGAILLTPNPNAASCSTPYAGTTQYTSQSNTDCDATGSTDDVWFKFTANYTLETVRFENVTATTGTVTAMAMNLYTGPACGGTASNCTTSITLTGGAGQANLTGLTPGTVYYLRVWTASASNEASFNICIIDPADMSYVSHTTVQDGTTSVGVTLTAGSVNAPIARVDIVVNGVANPFYAGNFNMNTNGTSVPADITKAKLWFQGSGTTPPAFNAGTATLLGTVTNPSGAFSFGPSALQLLQGGTVNTTNYFYLTYDVACTITGPNADAECNLVDIGGAPLAPATQAPAGNRTLAALTSFNTVADGNWNNAASWSCGIPTTNGTVDININHNITLDINFVQNANITVAAGKTLTINANSLTLGSAGSALSQNLTINGTVAVGGGTLTLGTATATVTGSSITVNSGGALTITAGAVNVGTATFVTTSNITVGTGGTLNVNGGTIQLGPTGGGKRTLSVTGTLNNTAGTLFVNGNVLINSGATWTQSGGDFNIDGNDGTSGGSVASGTYILSLANSGTSNTLSGGNLMFVDPHYSTTYTLYWNCITAHTNATGSHTVIFGDGASTTAGGTNGFYLNTWVGSYAIAFKNLTINTLSGTNRFVTSIYSFGIDGNLNITATSEFRPAVINYIAGNVVNNGIYTNSSTFYMARFQSRTIAAATTAQAISGSGTWRNLTASPTANMASFTVNNTSGTAITLPASMISGVGTGSVSGTLTLTAGKLAPAVNPLTVGISTASTGTITANATIGQSWVIGTIRKWIGGAVSTTFPVGTASTEERALINFTTAPSTLGSLDVSYTAGMPSGGPTVNPPLTQGANSITYVSPTGSWNASATNSLAGGTYTATFSANAFTGVNGKTLQAADIASIYWVKRPTGSSGTVWENPGTVVATTYSAPIFTISRSGVTTGFSEFALAGTTAALPIELKTFTARIAGKMNLLNWETASENNVREFIIERSLDGQTNWATLGTMPSKGNTTSGHAYEMEDRSPLAVSYYRLRTMDFDGKEQLSAIVVLVRKQDVFGISTVFPVPTTSDVNVQFEALEESDIQIRLTDLSGRLVSTQKISATKGINSLTLPLENLEAGVYLLTLDNGTITSQPARVVKQ